MTVGGSIGMAIGVVTLLTEFRYWPAVVFAVWIPIGIGQLIKARQRRIAFESEHGPNAGRQNPIT